MKPAVRALLVWGVLGTAAAGAADRSYQLSPAPGGDRKVTATYINYNSDPLSIAFTLAQKAVQDSMQEFGFSQAETKAMAQNCHCSQSQFDEKVESYYRSRGIAWHSESGVRHLYVDVPVVVARNRQRLRSVAAEFDHMTSAKQYDQDEALGAMITFVQSAVEYKGPPNQENGRDILGFYPPMRTLETGTGDCDTKSALLASILTNFPGVKMIGVHVPHHYLVGIARVPRAGDASIEYRGEPFVLIEAAGPGRLPPGTIAPTTQAALAVMSEVRIDPLF